MNKYEHMPRPWKNFNESLLDRLPYLHLDIVHMDYTKQGIRFRAKGLKGVWRVGHLEPSSSVGKQDIIIFSTRNGKWKSLPLEKFQMMVDSGDIYDIKRPANRQFYFRYYGTKAAAIFLKWLVYLVVYPVGFLLMGLARLAGWVSGKLESILDAATSAIDKIRRY